MDYSRKATANKAPGQPLVFTAPGRFESAPVGYFNVEVAAAAGRGRGDDDDNNDDNDDDDDDDNDDDNDDGNQQPSGGGIVWFPELNADATIRGWRAFLRRSETAKGRQRMGGPPSNAFDDDEASRFSG